jgi:hypothetical protein
MMKWKKCILPFLIVLIGYAILPLYSDANELPDDHEGDWSTVFQQHLDGWMEQVQKDPAFSSWNNSDREIETMGPGTHQWIVTMKKNNEVVGYMIVGAQPFPSYGTDGQPEKPSFVLIEYGIGEYPLFDNAALEGIGIVQADIKSIKDVEWVKWYGDALHALWWTVKGGEKVYFDAKSGERLPIHEDQLPDVQAPGGLLKDALLQELKTLSFGSPNDSIPVGWAAHPANITETTADLKKTVSNDGSHYVASLYNDLILAPFYIVGYHQWDSALFVSLEDEGHRFISIDVLKAWGEFFE